MIGKIQLQGFGKDVPAPGSDVSERPKNAMSCLVTKRGDGHCDIFNNPLR